MLTCIWLFSLFSHSLSIIISMFSLARFSLLLSQFSQSYRFSLFKFSFIFSFLSFSLIFHFSRMNINSFSSSFIIIFYFMNKQKFENERRTEQAASVRTNRKAREETRENSEICVIFIWNSRRLRLRDFSTHEHIQRKIVYINSEENYSIWSYTIERQRITRCTQYNNEASTSLKIIFKHRFVEQA